MKRQKEYHVRVLVLIDNPSVFKLDIEVLINRVKSSSNGEIVLELHCYFSAHQLLKIREEQLQIQKTNPKIYERKNGPQNKIKKKKKASKRESTMILLSEGRERMSDYFVVENISKSEGL